MGTLQYATETFLPALKAHADNSKKDLNRLNAYAKQMRLSDVIRNYLEVYYEQRHEPEGKKQESV